MRRASVVLAITVLAALALAACGGDDDDETTAAAPATTTAPAGGAGSTVDISTPASGLSYDQQEVTAKAGPVTIDFDNVQSLEHDVAVEDSAGTLLGKTDLVASGTATTTVNLQPASYTFYCTVAGHRGAGMEGTLTAQ